RFPKVNVIVDHFARPDVRGGPPYAAAAPLFTLLPVRNVYLKFTPVALKQLEDAKADVQSFLGKGGAEFCADRISLGSNWPNSPGTMSEHVKRAKDALARFSQKDQDLILGGTALRLYPALQGK